ncbi:hypothetical protein EDC52_102409 [Biostraticola tofi]|uniref:Uncharacterized protein n=1 Tax=Biostraticola tofi TaxID=466109 RepID=A0A4R3Z0E1_9GAMM|nr:hypothetical protein EDC52_102409 [Biostraticola tofi]
MVKPSLPAVSSILLTGKTQISPSATDESADTPSATDENVGTPPLPLIKALAAL